MLSIGQTSEVEGRLQDKESKAPLDLAVVVLKSLKDTQQIKTTRTKQDGTFHFDHLEKGNYKLLVNMMGYKMVERNNLKVNQKTDVGLIEMEATSKTLKDVNIISEKKDIEVSADKKKFNVDKNATTAGGTAADVLRNVPSVNVDMDGNVSLRGKDNVTILIDGKRNSMFENDPVTALQALPASSIESVEVITNPSSKYDAQGMNGIINIILKKDRKPGYNGLITFGAGMPFRLNTGINFNANVKKWNFFLNANGRTSKTWEETTNHRSNYENDQTFYSNTHNDRRPLNGFASFGFDYMIDKRNKITLTQNIFNANMQGNSKTVTENGILFNTVSASTLRYNHYTGKPLSPTTNLQYKHTFHNPKEELNVELNFSKTRYIRTSSFETFLFDSLSNMTTAFFQNNPVRGGNWNGTVQVDYTKPMFKNGRLDLGVKEYFIRFHSENQPTKQYLNQPEYPETLLKNHFTFTQQVHSVYSNVANQYHNTGVQLGLRAEYFHYEGFAYQYNAGASNSYINFFPTAFVTQKLSSKEDLTLNYSRRVNRPNFFQLIPYIDATNPQDTSQGNPALKPEFIHSIELGYTYQYGKSSTFLVSSYWQRTSNLIQRYRRFNTDGTTYSQNRNLATAYTYGLEVTNKMNILKWWDVTANVNVFRNDLQGANVDASLKRSGWGGFGKLNNNWRLIHEFSAQLTGNYYASTVFAQGVVRPYGNIDLALKKNLFKKSLTITATVNDLFNTIQTKTVYDYYPYYNQTVLRKNLTRTYGINLQWKFASKQVAAGMEMQKPKSGKKDKETKSRDENLKKDEGGEEMNNGNRER